MSIVHHPALNLKNDEPLYFKFLLAITRFIESKIIKQKNRKNGKRTQNPKN